MNKEIASPTQVNTIAFPGEDSQTIALSAQNLIAPLPTKSNSLEGDRHNNLKINIIQGIQKIK